MLDQNNASIVAETADMLEGLKFLKRVMWFKGTIPILESVLFPGDGTMRGTNLDQEGIWRLRDGDRTAGHGPFTVAVKALEKILAGADKGSLVTLRGPQEEGGKAGALVDGMHSRLSSLPAMDFPIRAEPGQLRIRFQMTEAELHDLLAFVDPCISSEDTRYYLNGVYFHPMNGVLKLVTTDGHKLGLRETAHAWEGDLGDGLIAPTCAVRAVLASLGKKSVGPVDVSIRQSKIEFVTPKWEIRSKHVDGTFPDYTRVIPGEADHAVTLPVADTTKILSRLFKMSGTNSRSMVIDTVNQEIELRDAEMDTHTLPLSGARVIGEGIRQGFNIAYMKAAFETFKEAGGVAVKLSTQNAASPTLMKAKGIDGCWVLMPMRY